MNNSKYDYSRRIDNFKDRCEVKCQRDHVTMKQTATRYKCNLVPYHTIYIYRPTAQLACILEPAVAALRGLLVLLLIYYFKNLK